MSTQEHVSSARSSTASVEASVNEFKAEVAKMFGKEIGEVKYYTSSAVEKTVDALPGRLVRKHLSFSIETEEGEPTE